MQLVISKIIMPRHSYFVTLFILAILFVYCNPNKKNASLRDESVNSNSSYNNPDNKQSEEKFKAANEANEVLSDSEKRKKYDELGVNWANNESYSNRSADYGRGGNAYQGFDGTAKVIFQISSNNSFLENQDSMTMGEMVKVLMVSKEKIMKQKLLLKKPTMELAESFNWKMRNFV